MTNIHVFKQPLCLLFDELIYIYGNTPHKLLPQTPGSLMKFSDHAWLAPVGAMRLVSQRACVLDSVLG